MGSGLAESRLSHLSGTHHRRQGMMVVAPYCWSAMLGVGRGQGVVLSHILEATKAGGTMDAVRLSFKENCLLPISLLGPDLVVPKLHEPEYPPQLPDSSEELSGSSLLGVDCGPKIS